MTLTTGSAGQTGVAAVALVRLLISSCSALAGRPTPGRARRPSPRRSLLYRETKTEASDASLPLPDIVATALQLRREVQEKARLEAGEAWQQVEGGPDLVFTGR